MTELMKKYMKETNTEESIYCAIEEMSEATKVLTKFLRKKQEIFKRKIDRGACTCDDYIAGSSS